MATWLYWDGWILDGLMAQLANIVTVSAGAALLATILKEAGWNMVLAAMKIKEWKEQGRKEERERRRKREEAAWAKFGVEVNGVLMLPQTPEVQRFLDGEEQPESEQ